MSSAFSPIFENIFRVLAMPILGYGSFRPRQNSVFPIRAPLSIFSRRKGFDSPWAICYNFNISVHFHALTSIINRRNYHMASETPVLSYKGHPLRRKDNLIYFGTMAEKYIVMMQILSTKKVGDLDVADKVSVQLQLTAPDLKSRDRVVKKSEKDSLYAAMDVACVWLERALTGK